MIENILILDTETTGLDPQKGAKLIEIGALLYNVQHKIVTQVLSSFFPCEENPCENINNIKSEWTKLGMSYASAIEMINGMAKHAYLVVAHNAEFDRKFMATLKCEVNNKRWICTKRDFRWPVTLFRNRLEDICKAMDVPYVNAHRAIADCTFLANCFTKVSDLEIRLQQAEQNEYRRPIDRNKFHE